MSRGQRDRMTPEATEGVAQAAYLSIEPEFDAYARMGLPSDERKLKGAFEAKQKALVEVQKRYADVVGFKIAEPAICSLYRIGLLYKNFADVLVNAPVPEMPFPKQLNPIKHLMDVPWKRWPRDYKEAVPEADFENLKQQLADAREQFKQAYRDQLAQWAVPVEEKAADAFVTTVEKARELSIYNECYQKALALLSDKYRPQRFPRVVEQMIELKALAQAAEGYGIVDKVQPIPATAKDVPAPTMPPPPPARAKTEPSSPKAAPPAQRPPEPARVAPKPPARDQPVKFPNDEPDDPELFGN